MPHSREALAVNSQHPRLPDPAEFQRPLSFYWQIVRRRIVTIEILSVVFTAVVIFLCALAPRISTGSALIAVDRQAAPETVGDDRLLATGDDQFMATQLNLLEADTILRPVAERYHLLDREHQLRRYFFWHYSPEKERAIRNAPIKLKHLKIQRDPNAYLLTITYKDEDPRLAADVANAVADSYLQNIFLTRVKEAGRLTSSMEQQLFDLKTNMEATHQALMKYQRDLGTADPEQKTSVLVAKLQALNTASSAAEADRILKEAVYREAKDGSLAEVEVSSQSSDLSKAVAQLELAKANLALIAATFGDRASRISKGGSAAQRSPRGSRREPPECL